MRTEIEDVRKIVHAFSRSRGEDSLIQLLIGLQYEPCHREICTATNKLISALSNRNINYLTKRERNGNPSVKS